MQETKSNKNFNFNDSYFITLLFILLIKALFISYFIYQRFIGLSPDEAQYWTWSETLDIGYYSKPPGIAWVIFLGSQIFPADGVTGELGVRFFSLIVGFLIPIATYFLAISCKLKERTAFFAALLMVFSPIGIAASFFATTDGPMVLFWVIASTLFIEGFNREKGPSYLLIGGVIALGALFKWPIYLFWIFPLIFYRFWNRELFFGICISLFGLLPTLIWNIQHDFATFKHVFKTIEGAPAIQISTQNISFFKGNFFEFLGAQAALISPFIFLMFLYSLYNFFKSKKDSFSKELNFCFLSSISLLALFMIAACFKKMQGNWAVFVYPGIFVYISYLFFEKKEKYGYLGKTAICLSLFLTTFFMLIPSVEERGFNIPYKFNPFRHQMGLLQLEPLLKEAGYNPKKDFLFSDKYQAVSQLSFYAEDQKRAYFLNLQGIRKNQFSYWPSLKERELGQTGYFVLIENSPHLKGVDVAKFDRQLQDYFNKVEFLGEKSLFFVKEEVVKAAFIFRCSGYNGKEPLKSDLY